MNPEKKIGFVFNGDSDGIIGQHLLLLSGVTPSIRVTGLKREIAILNRLPPLESADIRVLDLNLGANRAALEALLKKPGVAVTWYDHHEPGEIPESPRLKTHIHTAPGTCTAIIVHRTLPGSNLRWAAMAAFGDNLPEVAEALLRPQGISEIDIEALHEGGELINYNAYGETEADVLFHPLAVAERMVPFKHPGDFLRDSGLIEPLRVQFKDDQTQAGDLKPLEERGKARIYHLPAQLWARRLGSTFANRTALQFPESALAVLHPLQDGSFQVSIRSPREPRGSGAPASKLALEFATGGGRALAAGINRLPVSEVEKFQKRFFEVYGG